MQFADIHEDILVYFEEPEMLDCDPTLTANFHTKHIGRHSDVESYIESNTKLVFAAVFPYAESKGGGFAPRPLHEIEKQIQTYHNLIAKHPEFQLVLTKSDLEKVLDQQGKVGIVIHLEGFGGITDPSLVKKMYGLGVRSAGLCWNTVNEICSHCEEEQDNGLSQLGHAFVQEIVNLGMVLDLSHASFKTQEDILNSFDYKKIIYSHSGVWEEYPFSQNIKAKQAKEVSSRGGLLGITFFDRAIRGKNEATVADYIKHLQKVSQYANSLAIGTDFFGFKNHRGLREVDRITDLPVLYEQVTKHFSKEFADKLFSENVITFLRNNLN